MAVRDLMPWHHHDDALTHRRSYDSPFLTLQKNMNRLFERFPWGLGTDSFLDAPSSTTPFVPSLDISQDDNTIRIQAEMPGMDEKDIHVSLDDGVLVLEGEKKEHHEEEKNDRCFSECCYGHFHREVALPADVDEDNVEAAFSKGVLTITLPKSAEARTRHKPIEVKSTP